MSSPRRSKLVFALRSYEYLVDSFIAAGNYERGSIKHKVFPDGERYRRILDDPWGRDVVLLGGTPREEDWLELYDVGCGLARAGARSLSIVMPYFGYSTMERAALSGEVVTAKTRARLICAIPPCEAGTRVFLFDLHTEGIEFYFSDSHMTHHIQGAPLIVEAIEQIADQRPYVLGAVDAGRAKWVERLTRRLRAEPAFVYKRRDSQTGKLGITGINADVSGKLVIIYDDMIRTGSSLLQAARAYREAGATEVHAVVSHLILPGDSLERLVAADIFTTISGTNSHPRSAQITERQGRLISVGPLLAKAVARS